MSKLLIDEVGKVFAARGKGQPTRALMPTSLTVADNDFITILGPSGCGKSTLLRIIGGWRRQARARSCSTAPPSPGRAPIAASSSRATRSFRG